MRVGYIDLNYTNFYEDYSLSPKRYGGGRVFAAWCKEYFDFRIFGCPETFDNVADTEARDKCISLSPHEMTMISNGAPLSDFAPKFENVDLFVYPHTNTYLNLGNLNAKQCVWAVGEREPVHEKHEHVILYNDFQKSVIHNPNAKIYKFNLGIKTPDFKTYRKEDFIFQCSRHVPVFSSIEVAQFCLNHRIRGYFAGPIGEDYDFLRYIDNKTTFYLGEISEEVKRDYLSRARLCTLLHNWETPFSLSAIESLAFGTPVACVGLGFWPSLIKEGVNGFYVHNDFELKRAWDTATAISQRDCYGSVLQYNHLNMTQSVMKCFEQILQS